MAKRPKLKNIQISNQELTPTTIGYLENKQKGPFLLVVIFVILFATLYYLPNLTEYFTGADIPNDGNPAGNIVTDEGTIFMINHDTKITINHIEFSKINLEGNKISIFANNTKDAIVALENYYIELYNKNDKLMERVDLSNETLNKFGKRTLSYNIDNQEEIVKIAIIIMNNKYPEVNLNEENGSQFLSCSNDSYTYKYEFKEKKLKKVIKTVNLSKNDFNDENSYNSQFQKYLAQADKFPIHGIVSSFSNTLTDFTFTQSVDLIVVFAENVDDPFYYALDESADKIAFQNSLKKYKCY